MADKKIEKPSGWNFDPIEGIIVLIFLAALLGMGIPAILKYFTSGELSFYGFKLSGIVGFFESSAWFWRALGFIIAGVAAVGTFIYTKKGDAVVREEKAKVYLDTNFEKVNVGIYPQKSMQNPLTGKWEKILKLSESENPSDWRLAIIEADIMLDDLLAKLQLPGDTIGDKLKAVSQATLRLSRALGKLTKRVITLLMRVMISF